ncbi:MAG TPA: metal-dependent hydrolase [Nitrospira sp.]|nr:metal-dependent hydrolase [Nitrospira sp.]
MSGRTHAMVPAALAATLFNADPVLTLTAAAAGLVPDIDEPWSVIGMRLWFLAWWMKFVFGHRTVSHSLLMVVTVAIVGIVALMPIKMVLAVSIGLATHLVLDAMSGGVQLWWPKKDRWVLGRYPVYGGMDQLLLVVAMMVAVGCLLMRISEEVRTASDEGQQSVQAIQGE